MPHFGPFFPKRAQGLWLHKLTNTINFNQEKKGVTNDYGSGLGDFADFIVHLHNLLYPGLEKSGTLLYK